MVVLGHCTPPSGGDEAPVVRSPQSPPLPRLVAKIKRHRPTKHSSSRSARPYADLQEAGSPHLQQDPEKWVPVFRKRSCSNNKTERDDDSKKSHRALVQQPGVHHGVAHHLLGL